MPLHWSPLCIFIKLSLASYRITAYARKIANEDVCPSMVSRWVMTEALDTIMHSRDMGRAQAIFDKHLADIREDRVPFEDFALLHRAMP